MRAATLVSRLLNYPFTGPAALFRSDSLWRRFRNSRSIAARRLELTMTWACSFGLAGATHRGQTR